MLYDYLKAFHVIAVIAWMAGMLYLPRLFVYHAEAGPGSAVAATLALMEVRLQRFIMLPALIAVFGLGIWLLLLNPDLLTHPYMHVKLTCVAAMAALHMYFARLRRDLCEGRRPHTARFYRLLNEAPTVLMIVIVIMIIVRPGV